MSASEPFGLAVRTECGSDRSVVAVSGEFDLAGVATFAEAVDDLLRTRPPRIEVDAGGVVYIDSSGIRALLEAQQGAAATGTVLSVTVTSEALDQILEMTGLRAMLCDAA